VDKGALARVYLALFTTGHKALPHASFSLLSLVVVSVGSPRLGAASTKAVCAHLQPLQRA
ncbi:MAG: hypothetical protein AAF337_12385, partial [Pseudomonadota bacterium]